MKTQPHSAKLNDSLKYTSETNLDQSVLSTFSCESKKNSTTEVTTTPHSLKSLNVSIKNSIQTTKNIGKNKSKSRKSPKNANNSSNGEKKKLVRKENKIPGKLQKIPRKVNPVSKPNTKIQSQVKFAGERNENMKKRSNKQNIETKENQNQLPQELIKSIEIKPKQQTASNQMGVTLEEWIEIKMLMFERRQLQTKREDLLKRNVEDWDQMQKGRSAYRELRILGN